MQKGKFGFSLWLYPFIALWTVLLWTPFASIVIMLFVMAVEKNDWAIKQCIHVVMFNIYWSIYLYVIDFLVAIPLVGTVFSIIDFVVWVIMMILITILGILRLRNGQEIGLPGKGIVNRAFGLMQNFQQGYGQPQYGQPAQQYQPYPPQQGAPAQPPYAPPYAPPQQNPYQAAPTPPPVAPAPGQQQAAPPPPPASPAPGQQQAAPPPPPPASPAPGQQKAAPPPPPPAAFGGQMPPKADADSITPPPPPPQF
jgi:hypothetical protein